ncbi:cytochrome C assembly family protein [Verminephrobacter aporrectodeae]|uniref:Cytochrome C assembly protein n=1 Tax=Verminephrobacter aporrectodeae subsp. tuberculatae TaxID=1110392 RepID=A0ABT3KU47_9BURK|nr:cytochrome c biogenesis protein CcsA [Verminephrobacter aporrectodeae]MCW5222400.1 cytochrome C assembly protein [Verminephrobacter aporrectodeae subsp. tuberculatae]MCW5257392.1 cytochrome C assembly protein [Verminephrobacter aporrectodeae subsp. tuberculatae]MCW5287864.1 cytochrome C assembly protein [Verminephrobacter aporrectodeae subsp. tuberculatae]MCW5321424.1 cytochrome C assembly protein [Verminephrobacter aporrectodeae subsp. tuberculatae]MCW8164611.1 cytochrome C assembly protei
MILPGASPVSWLLVLAATVAYAVPAAAASRLGAVAARNALSAAWMLHGAVLVWGLAGDPPRFGFAPALSMTAWLVLTVYAVERQLFPQMQARWVLAALGAVAIVLAVLFPGQPLHVSASPWLPLHLALGLACYGLFAAAVVHAWLMTRAEHHIRQAEDPHSGIPLLTLERLTFRFVTAGFVLLTATLLAGWLFGDTLYGRAWRWDHKAVFSLLSWLAFAALLLGRARFGWRGRSAVRVLYAGSALLLLAYVGSRFVLEVVLGRSA